jgi:hypothetical protein
MSKAIDEALYSTLIADTSDGSAHDLVSGRISASYGDAGDDLPLITFEQVGSVTMQPFGGASLHHDETYDISIVGRWEDGLAEIGDIADAVIELFGNPVFTTATNFDRVIFELASGATIARDDEHLVATIGLRARAVQTGGL